MKEGMHFIKFSLQEKSTNSFWVLTIKPGLILSVDPLVIACGKEALQINLLQTEDGVKNDFFDGCFFNHVVKIWSKQIQSDDGCYLRIIQTVDEFLA